MGVGAGTDLHRRRNRQVPDLRAQDAALPGELSVGRGHPRLAQHRARGGEAAQGHEHAGVLVPPLDRRQSVSLDDGTGVSRTLPDRLQSQRGGRLRRHQRGRAVHRRLCAGAELRFPGRARYRQARCDRGRRPGGPLGRLSTAPQRACGHPVRRSRRVGGHGEVRCAGLPSAAQASGWGDQPHHRDGRRGPVQHAHRRRRSPQRPRRRLRRGAARDRLQSRPQPAGSRGGRAQLHQRRRVSRGLQPGPAAIGRRPRGGGWRRRYLGRRRLGGAAAGLCQGHEGDRAPGVRGDGLHRARRLGHGGAARRRRAC